jgi:hypothetical protein
MVNLLKPFEIIFSGLKYTFKGIRWGLNRPEAEFAVMLLPMVNYGKAAFILKKMIEAEDALSSGDERLPWVLEQIAELEAGGKLSDDKAKELTKIIKAMVPLAEGNGVLVQGEADANE